jgi:hypothetical protein
MNQRRKILGMLVLLSCKSVLRLYPVIRVTWVRRLVETQLWTQSPTVVHKGVFPLNSKDSLTWELFSNANSSVPPYIRNTDGGDGQPFLWTHEMIVMHNLSLRTLPSE